MTQQISTDIAPGTYLIDPARSSVRFTATHSFGRKPVDGTFTVRAGTVVVAAEPRRSTVSAELDAASFSTDHPRRNKDILGPRFLDAATWPVLGFRSTRLARTESGWQLIGELSVRGGSSELALDLVAATREDDGYRIMATGRIDRLAAGVTAGRGLISRHVATTITVHID